MSLQIKNLWISYSSSKKPVVENFSLTVSPGDLIVLRGRNGTGKSTILEFLALYAKQKQGKFEYNADKIEIEEDISIIYQEPVNQLLTFTVFEELATKLSYRKVDRESRKTKIEKIISNYDLEEIQFKDPRNISSGEQQKVVVLANLVDTRGIILLDEPFTYLDESNISKFIELIIVLRNKGNTIIIASHFDYLKEFKPRYYDLNHFNIEKGKEKIILKASEERTIHNISIGYNQIIKNLKLNLPKSGVVIVKGPNGSGKTCLLSSISGLIPLKEGKMDLGDSSFFLPEKVSYIFSKPTVKEELGKIKIPEILKDKLTLSPFHLSVGERKFLAIYIILMKFDICIFDEPFQSLDYFYSKEVLNLIEKFSQNKLIIFSTNKHLEDQLMGYDLQYERISVVELT